MDDLGRVVIPKELRRCLHIVDGDPLELSFDPEQQALIVKRCNTADGLLGPRTCSIILAILRERAEGCVVSIADFAGQPIKRYTAAQIDEAFLNMLNGRHLQEGTVVKGNTAAVPISTIEGELAVYIILTARDDGEAGQKALHIGIEQAQTVAAMVKMLVT